MKFIRKYKKYILMILIGFLTLAAPFLLFSNKENKDTVYQSYNSFKMQLESNEIETVYFNKRKPILNYKLKEDEIRYYTENPNSEDYKLYLLNQGIKIEDTTYDVDYERMMVDIGPTLIFFIIAIYLIFRMMSSSIPNLFQSNGEAEIPDVTFDDVGGNGETIEEFKKLKKMIENIDQFKKEGVKIPKGHLLYGPPGTGKTYMMKALAGEAGIKVLYRNSASLVEIFAGTGPRKVKDTFKEAKKSDETIIIFFDELDAIGSREGSSLGGASESERTQTLLALLNELDGFQSSDNFIFIGSTNMKDSLDPALLSRLKNQIYVGLPNRKDRTEILDVLLKNRQLAEDLTTKLISSLTQGFSGRDLDNLVNQCNIYRVQDKRKKIDHLDFDKAYYKILTGSDSSNNKVKIKKDIDISSIHESGHAIMSLYQGKEVTKLSIIGVGNIGGFTHHISEESSFLKKSEYLNEIKILYAGRAAEEIFFGKDNVSTGAYNDIERASVLIEDYFVKYGFSKEVGLINERKINEKTYVGISKSTLSKITNLSKVIYDETITLLKENKDIIKNLSLELKEYEEIKGSNLEKYKVLINKNE